MVLFLIVCFSYLQCRKYFLTKYLMGFNGIEMQDAQLNNSFANLFFCLFILSSCSYIFFSWSFIFSSFSFLLFSCSFILFSLFDWIMGLYILFISLKMLKSFSWGLILLNTHLTSLSNLFCLSISLLRFLSTYPNSSTSIASLYLWKLRSIL